MDKKQKISVAVILGIGAVLAALILNLEKTKPAGRGHDEHAKVEQGHKDEHGHGHKDEHGHDDHGDEDVAKGPHGGRLFVEGDFGIEVVLAEEAGEARFLAYLYQQNKPAPASSAKVSVTLTRPDGEQQEISFAPEKDHLKSAVSIPEPHVFEATVAAQTASEPFLFAFSQQEGKVALSDAQIKNTGVTLQTAGPARIKSELVLPGEIRFNEDRTAHVVPRLAGVVEAVPANLGQQVKKGQVLAVVASATLASQRSERLAAEKRLTLARMTFQREKALWEEKISAEQDYLQARQALHEAEIAAHNTQQQLDALGAGRGSAGALNRYEIRAPFDAMVVEKHITLGEALKEDAHIFTLSDLSTVWAEVVVPAKELGVVRVGAKARVKATAFDSQALGSVSYVSALIGEQTRSAKARISLANPELAWRPGLPVEVELISEEADVPVAVAAEAIHTIADAPVVFVRIPGGFVPQPVTLGRGDGRRVEVVRGLKAGTPYAAAGSFIVKAEHGKAGAAHEH